MWLHDLYYRQTWTAGEDYNIIEDDWIQWEDQSHSFSWKKVYTWPDKVSTITKGYPGFSNVTQLGIIMWVIQLQK